jgi:hypothetical protein
MHSEGSPYKPEAKSDGAGEWGGCGRLSVDGPGHDNPGRRVCAKLWAGPSSRFPFKIRMPPPKTRSAIRTIVSAYRSPTPMRRFSLTSPQLCTLSLLGRGNA